MLSYLRDEGQNKCHLNFLLSFCEGNRKQGHFAQHKKDVHATWPLKDKPGRFKI